MTMTGPHLLNGGWVSDADLWNPPGKGRCLTYECMNPFQGGARTMDGVLPLVNVMPNAKPIAGFFFWQDPAQEGVANTSIYIALTNGSSPKCYTADAALSTWTDRTAAVSLPTLFYYTFDVLNAKVLIANTGLFKISAYNGNIAVLAGSPPPCNIVKVVNNFAFIAQNLSSAATMSRVYWSNVGDPETWTAANYVDVRINDGDIITGLSSIGSDLIIFKTNSIHRLSTVTSAIGGSVTLGPLTIITDKYGCVGQHALDVMPDGSIVFISPDGHLHQTDGSIFNELSHNPWPSSNISYPLTPNTANGGIPPQFLPFSSNFVRVDSENNRIFCIYKASSGTIHKVYVYNYLLGAWADWTKANSGTDFWQYCTTVPYIINAASGYGGGRRRLVLGSFAGYAHMLTTYIGAAQVVDQTVSLTCTCEATISLGGETRGFIPRYLLVPILKPQGASSYTRIHVFIGWDGIYQGTAAFDALYTGSPPLVPARIVVPLYFTPNATSGITPTSIQIKLQFEALFASAVVGFGPFFLSDEVLT